MRERDISELTKLWFRVMSACYAPTQRKHTSHILNLSLKVVGLYVRWIDIGLIVNDNFMPLIYQMLQEPGCSDDTDSQLRLAACETLTEVCDYEWNENHT
jgi:exportin-T